jgi:branched-chain amino acid transport system permease protein
MDWNFEIFPNFFFNGLKLGAIYAVVAVALVLIFKATTLINFAQGELAMIGAFIVYILNDKDEFAGLPLWLAIVLAMVISAGLGALIERALVRPFDPDDHLPVVLITLGLFLILNAVAGDIWNYQVRPFDNLFGKFPGWVPSVGGDRFVKIGDTRLFYDTIGIWLTLALSLFGLGLLLNKTKIGLSFRGVSSNVESARLVGVNTGRTLGFGWALASAFGTLGAALVAPSLGGVQPNMMGAILIYSLAGAALGGLDSLGGAVLGGVLVGLIQSVVVSWFGVVVMGQDYMSILQLAAAFVVILIVLLFRPAGLFGTQKIERV